MKCPKCHYTMEKDYDTRTATCPICGKTKHYKSKADKKRGYRYYPEFDSSNNTYPRSSTYGSYGYGSYGCGTFILIILVIAIIAIVGGILALFGVFRNGLWAGLGDILMFFLNLIWKILSGIATFLWRIIVWLFHRIFG